MAPFETSIAKVTPASLQHPENPIVSELSVPLPDFMTGADGALKPGLKEVSGLTPMFQFQQYGEFAVGRWVGTRSLKVDGRDQLIHDLNVDKSVHGYEGIAGIWGSAALDMRIKAAIDGGMKPGASIFVQYVDEQDTGKGNPAKLFRVIWK